MKITAILFSILILFSLYLAFRPFTMVAYYNEPFPIVSQKPIKKGDTLIYNVKYCKSRSYTVLVTKYIIDIATEKNQYIGETDVNLPLKEKVYEESSILPFSASGCTEETATSVDVPIKIPEYISTGEKVLEIQLLYKINPLRTKAVKLRTQSFYIQ